MSKEISGTTKQIFTKCLGLVELYKDLINPAFIWRSLNGCCHDNQLKLQNQRFLQTNLHSRAAIPKWIGISECLWAAQKHIECGYIVYKFGEVRCSNSVETYAYFVLV